MAEVRRPERQPGKAIEDHVLRLKANETMNVCILSPSVWQVGTHWNSQRGRKGRSEPCIDPKELCEGCRLERPYKWRGYLYSVPLFEKIKTRFFLEITEGMDDALQQMVPRGESLRARSFRFTRGASDAARVRVEPVQVSVDPLSLPGDKDPVPFLEKLWGISFPRLAQPGQSDVAETLKIG